MRGPLWWLLGCILSKFYIKPQLRLEREFARCSCILSKFYIKPQLLQSLPITFSVVSYRNSTSNHNEVLFFDDGVELYLIEILHQTTTIRRPVPILVCCILSKFYIKPQQSPSTKPSFSRLYLIEILHQTTTTRLSSVRHRGCILSKFYIKPQPRFSWRFCCCRCILSKFYIKPQQLLERIM